MDKLANTWGKFIINQIDLERAMAVSGVDVVSKDMNVWEQVKATFKQSTSLSHAEVGFDQMRESTQKRVIRAENIIKTLNALCGDRSVIYRDDSLLYIASLTESGRLYQQFGGVVLDATANTISITAIRPDADIVDLHVVDSKTPTDRRVFLTEGLSKTALKTSHEAFQDAINSAKRECLRWGYVDKIAVFTHKDMVPKVKLLWPEVHAHHFGDTRGYDFYFQEGYNAFITLGDPISNLTALQLQWRVFKGTMPSEDTPGWAEFIEASAESELAQAHGRARNPQTTKAKSGRVLHLHFGKRSPVGWDQVNSTLDFS
jgi:hypothetical protein